MTYKILNMSYINLSYYTHMNIKINVPIINIMIF